jgi:hypothetical protein
VSKNLEEVKEEREQERRVAKIGTRAREEKE